MADWAEIEARTYMRTFKRNPVTLVRGEGVRIWDDSGREYLDFVAGIAVVCLGHGHPVLAEAVAEQARTLIQTSNLYYTIPQLQLAELLVERSVCDRVFFANSGAEACEGAVKLARKWGKLHKGGAYEIITAFNSFHGRTLAMVAATGQPQYQAPYTPLTPGFVHVPFSDLDALKAATNERTVGVMLEVVQGEGGVNLPDPDYLTGVRAWCNQQGLLLILDEVQTGVGRLGTLWGYESYGIEPDIMTLAKGLAGGVPIGAILAKESASAFATGDHGSTFGGNALACAAGYAVLKYIIDQDLPGHVTRVGDYLQNKLLALKAQHPLVESVRGKGLLIACQLGSEVSGKVAEGALGEGLLVNPVTPSALRFMPPLVVTEAEIDQAIERLSRALSRVEEQTLATVPTRTSQK